ncbi:cytochrome P450 [Trichoderma evansii]
MFADKSDRLWLLAAGLVTTASYFVVRLIRHRLKYRDLPCPPHSMFWGHLKLVGEYVKNLPQGAFMLPVIAQLQEDYNLPDIFYIDLWPLGPQFTILASPEACAIPTTENTFDQHEAVPEFYHNSGVGTGFIEASNGPLWKHLHQTLTPGLTPSVIRGSHIMIVEQAVALHHRFRNIAKSGEVTDIRHEFGHYPFSVMGQMLLNETLDAQIYEDLSAALNLRSAIHSTNNPFVKWRLNKDENRLWKRIGTAFEPKIRARFTALQQQENAPTKKNVTALLDRIMLSDIQGGRALGDDLLRLMLDNARGFMVAGSGTTTDTSSYILMLLSVFPDVLQKLREEHDQVFDKDHNKTVQMLQEQPGLIRNLVYTTAVINETLRMFNVGMTVRAAPSNMPSMEYKGRSYPIKGQFVTNVTHMMHHDPKYFDEPKLFKPERFLAAEPSWPHQAYRPFEKGLRSCIGQPLAMDEMKIMLVMVARSFDFELRDHNPTEKPKYSFTDLDTKLGKHAVQGWTFSAGPAGKVMMRVTERSF